jgi:RHS repeat-associated protein
MVESYGYDALGRRVYVAQGSTTNWLVYNGIHVVAEVNASGQLQKSYTWGGLDRLLALTVYSGSTGTTFTALTDVLGTVHALANTNGAIVESYRFDAFGRVLEVFNSSGQPISESAIGNSVLWGGKFYSCKLHVATGGAGIYYNRFRVLDPCTGRFLSKDPIGISGGMHLYLYAGGDPVNNVDWLGLCKGGDGTREVSSEEQRIDRVSPFGYLVWFWDSLFVHRMDYGFRSVYDGLPDSYRIGDRTFESTPNHNQFSNYMIGRMGYYSGGNLGYLGARLGGHLGALSDRGVFDFRNMRLDDAGSIEMMRLGRQDAIRAEQEARARTAAQFQQDLRNANPLGNSAQQIRAIQRLSFGW